MSDDELRIDDGGEKPIGYVSPDGELEIRRFQDAEGIDRVGWHETELGQHQRWMRQAPDLFALYQDALERVYALKRKYGEAVKRADDSL